MKKKQVIRELVGSHNDSVMGIDRFSDDVKEIARSPEAMEISREILKKIREKK